MNRQIFKIRAILAAILAMTVILLPQYGVNTKADSLEVVAGTGEIIYNVLEGPYDEDLIITSSGEEAVMCFISVPNTADFGEHSIIVDDGIYLCFSGGGSLSANSIETTDNPVFIGNMDLNVTEDMTVGKLIIERGIYAEESTDSLGRPSTYASVNIGGDLNITLEGDNENGYVYDYDGTDTSTEQGYLLMNGGAQCVVGGDINFYKTENASLCGITLYDTSELTVKGTVNGGTGLTYVSNTATFNIRNTNYGAKGTNDDEGVVGDGSGSTIWVRNNLSSSGSTSSSASSSGNTSSSSSGAASTGSSSAASASTANSSSSKVNSAGTEIADVVAEETYEDTSTEDFLAYISLIEQEIEDADSAASNVITMGDIVEMTSLPNSIMQSLVNHPTVSLVFEFVYNGMEYSVTIPAGQAVNNDIPWYGPAYLLTYYGEGSINVASKTSATSSVSTGKTYTVQSGDTFSQIASDFDLTIAELTALNPQVGNINLIYPGDIIFVG